MPETLLKCFSCHETFKAKETEFADVPSNFIAIGSSHKTTVPKCPHCGAVAFFGFSPAIIKKEV